MLYFPAAVAQDKSHLLQHADRYYCRIGTLCNLLVFCPPGSQVCPLDWLLGRQRLKAGALFTFTAIRKQVQRWRFTRLLFLHSCCTMQISNRLTKVKNRTMQRTPTTVFFYFIYGNWQLSFSFSYPYVKGQLQNPKKK